MGIEALAVFPAAAGFLAMAALFLISGRRNLRHAAAALLFSIALAAVATAVLFATVFLFERLGMVKTSEIFYCAVAAVVVYGGLRQGRTMFGFTAGEGALQGIVALCGCAAATLCFLGWTVRI